MSTTTHEALLTPQEVASLLSTTERHLDLLRKRGELTATKIGRKVRYRLADVGAYLDTQREHH